MADPLQHSQANVPTFYVGKLLPITPCVGWPEPGEKHLAAIRNPDVRGRHFGHVVLKDEGKRKKLRWSWHYQPVRRDSERPDKKRYAKTDDAVAAADAWVRDPNAKLKSR